jgi:hypothetical protein
VPILISCYNFGKGGVGSLKNHSIVLDFAVFRNDIKFRTKYQAQEEEMKKLWVFVLAMALAILFLPAKSISADVTLAWDASSSPEVIGYNFYYGFSSRNYLPATNVGNNTAYTLTNLQSGVVFYFAVTAYDENGTESYFSTELSYAPGGYLLWGKTKQVKLQELDTNYDVVNTHTYDLYDEWSALSVARNKFGKTYVLFTHTSRVSVLWEMTDDLSTYANYFPYSPDSGWYAKSIVIDESNLGYLGWWNPQLGLDVTWVMSDYNTWSSFHYFYIYDGWYPASTNFYDNVIYRLFVRSSGLSVIWDMDDWSWYSSYHVFNPQYTGDIPLNFLVHKNIGHFLWRPATLGQAILWLMPDFNGSHNDKTFSLAEFSPVWYFKH